MPVFHDTKPESLDLRGENKYVRTLIRAQMTLNLIFNIRELLKPKRISKILVLFSPLALKETEAQCESSPDALREHKTTRARSLRALVHVGLEPEGVLVEEAHLSVLLESPGGDKHGLCP